ncbi:hypothetical protein PMI01_04670 [Caulobacter sp. AP07]|uniref:hypothetical protein n=1 Tax=Caulobacter sp. AP07 TaxID=1144304 RepID=UPI000271DA62|nr:hypothetical protein [Caulobacter sp. AP07]EJL24287.1 hypothetical protein PMI01_04670 [Caulobacter sp. AP07]
MGQRRKTGDGARLPAISRRAVIGAAGAPLAGPARGWATTGAADIPARCATWIALDREIARLAGRWSDLETLATRQFDYFKLSTAQVSALPMGAEMDAIDAESRRLGDAREEALKLLGKLTPRTLHDVSAQLAVACRLLQYEEGEAWPFVRKAWTYLSRSHCPGCGAAYAPS